MQCGHSDRCWCNRSQYKYSLDARLGIQFLIHSIQLLTLKSNPIRKKLNQNRSNMVSRSHNHAADREVESSPNDQSRTKRPRGLMCGPCLLNFKSEDERDAHRRLKHFYCESCRHHKCYGSQEALDRHQREIHPDKWCEFCRRYVYVLKVGHFQMCHKHCRQCDKYFQDLNGLDKHIAEKHPG